LQNLWADSIKTGSLEHYLKHLQHYPSTAYQSVITPRMPCAGSILFLSASEWGRLNYLFNARALNFSLAQDLTHRDRSPQEWGLKLEGSLICVDEADLALKIESYLPKSSFLLEVNSVYTVMASLGRFLQENRFFFLPTYNTPFQNSTHLCTSSMGSIGSHAEAQVHPTAQVDGTIEENVHIGPFCSVAAGVYIGSGTTLEAHCTIYPGVYIGKNCRLQAGVVLGAAGFGFYDTDYKPMPHLAGVHIYDDVWIGAQTVVAAGVWEPTKVGQGCRLDSFVQIAHNVDLGSHSALASQSGIAGSTVTGEYLRMGGNASIAGHLYIGSCVTLGAKSGVTRSVPDGETWAGFPARPIRQWLRTQVKLN